MNNLYNLCGSVGVFGIFTTMAYTILAPKHAINIYKNIAFLSSKFCLLSFSSIQNYYDNYMKHTINGISSCLLPNDSAKITFVEDGVETDVFYNLNEYIMNMNTISTYDFIVYKQLINNTPYNIILNNESNTCLSKNNPIYHNLAKIFPFFFSTNTP